MDQIPGWRLPRRQLREEFLSVDRAAELFHLRVQKWIFFSERLNHRLVRVRVKGATDSDSSLFLGFGNNLVAVGDKNHTLGFRLLFCLLQPGLIRGESWGNEADEG